MEFFVTTNRQDFLFNSQRLTIVDLSELKTEQEAKNDWSLFGLTELRKTNWVAPCGETLYKPP